MMNMKAQSPFLIHHSAFIIHHFLQRLAFDDAHRRRGVDDAREAEAGGVVECAEII